MNIETFIEIDDDITGFEWRLTAYGESIYYSIKNNIDDILTVLIEFYEKCGRIDCLSIGQTGGDFTGGGVNKPLSKRKMMGFFICSTRRRFEFIGRINEDVNTYAAKARAGNLFIMQMMIVFHTITTQSQKGGLTEIYLEYGTYLKSFYSVMYCPSGVKVMLFCDGQQKNEQGRYHHNINWNAVAPKILRPQA